MPKKYPPDFKADVASVARRGDMTMAEAAADFGIPLESVCRWKRQAEIDDGIVDGLTSAEQSEIAQLRRDRRRLSRRNDVLRRATAYFAKDAAPNDAPLVRDLAAEGIPVVVNCRCLGLSPQAFFHWCASPCSARDLDDAHLTNAIVDVHADDREFGYRFIADELESARHVSASRGCGGCARRTDVASLRWHAASGC